MSDQEGDKRIRHPVMRTTYTSLGNPTEMPTATGGSSGATAASRTQGPPGVALQADQVPGSSTAIPRVPLPSPERKYSPVSSTASSASLLKIADNEARAQLIEMESQHYTQLDEIEDQLQECEEVLYKYQQQPDAEELAEAQHTKQTLLKKIERLTSRFNRKKYELETKLAVKKEHILLTSEEQNLEGEQFHRATSESPTTPSPFAFEEDAFQNEHETNVREAPRSPATVEADKEIQSILMGADYEAKYNPLPFGPGLMDWSQIKVTSTSRLGQSSHIKENTQQALVKLENTKQRSPFPEQLTQTKHQQQVPSVQFQHQDYPFQHQNAAYNGSQPPMVNTQPIRHVTFVQPKIEATATSRDALSHQHQQLAQRSLERPVNLKQMPPFQEPHATYIPHAQQPFYVPYQQQPQPQHQQNYQHYNRQPPPPPPDPIEALTKALNRAIGGGSRADKKLPAFDGKPSEWCNFNEAYKRTHHRYDQGENMMRIQESLRGEARTIVEHLLVNPNNINAIRTKLESRYGRPELILRSQIDKARSSKPIDGKPESIAAFGTMVEAIIANISAYNLPGYLHDRLLVDELVVKLPPQEQSSWYKWLVEDRTRQPDLENFSQFLMPIVEAAVLQIKPSEKTKEPRAPRRQGVHVAETKEKGSSPDNISCNFCRIPGHKMIDCRKFRQRPIDEKWKFVQDNALCRKCFQSHHSKDCSKKGCPVNNCGKPHHSTLHRDEKKKPTKGQEARKPPSPSNSEIEERIEEASLSGFNASSSGRSAYVADKMGTLPIIPVYLEGQNGKKKRVFALLDSGADFSMIEDNVARELGLQGKKSTLHFSVFGGTKKEPSSLVSVKVSGAFKRASRYKLSEVHTVPKLGISGVSVDADRLRREFPHLRHMKLKSLKNAVPQMLLGYSCYELFAAKQSLECPKLEGPSAYRSRLGWYVKMTSKTDLLSCHMASYHPDNVMHDEIKQFFSTESFGVTPIPNSQRSKEDIRALTLLEKHTVKKENKWETCLLWKQDNPTLPASKTMALKRLHAMEKKMDRDPSFSKLVEAKFEDYIQKGYLQPREKEDIDHVPTAKKWYLPWFFVHHPTKKPRLVFDAAAKVGDKSLNDFLLKGPDFLNSLPSVLMRFRRHKIALTADIREMFHQVGLRKEDWPSQTILYRGEDRSQPPREYYMTVLFFGSASSPCSAIYAKNRNAEAFREVYPKAVEAIIEDFYMDDYLGGADTEKEAIQLQQQLIKIHQSGGFDLVKWNSSSPRVLDAIPEELRSEGSIGFQEKTDLVTDKTLGLWWCPATDEFSFKLNFHRVPVEVSQCHRIPTKRQMTSIVMAVFDPLGFLAPLKVKALMLIQDVWRSGIGWDDEIPAKIFEGWKWWVEKLTDVKGIKVPRRLTENTDIKSVTLHTFCDASEEAFCSSVYAVFESKSHSPPQTAFMFGKARVAPLKGLTIPKMELQAALMGSRISETVKKTFKSTLPITTSFYWSDSRSVLAQIRSNTLRYKVFEANRIGEILTLSNVCEWKWVPTAVNVADDGTRFTSQLDLSSSSRWLTGPQFILEEKEKWPPEPQLRQEVSVEDMGVKVVSCAEKNVTAETTFDRCSSWIKLIRSSARVIKFIDILKYQAEAKVASKNNRPIALEKPKPYVTCHEQERAKQWLIIQSQQQSFPEEFEAIQRGDPIKKQSKLYGLSPSIDSSGMIVLQGRINQAPAITTTVKNPPILDPNHKITKLLIEWIHQRCGHQGQEQVLHKLRKEAWVINARSAVRRCWFNCFECKKARAQPNQPAMGQLPVSRLGESHTPFYHTGVDFFGPINVTFGRKTIKRWGVLFTCLSTRAVHLELADGLDINSFVDCFIRFKSLRGKPRHLWSDNGTNFVGTNREFKEAMEEFNQKVPEAIEVQGVEWHFNPPSAPHMGGSWERLVGYVKKILSHLLKESNPREATLRTLFAEITDILNDRPLTYASPDPNDPECLTPNHFLRLTTAPQQSVPGEYTNADKYQKAWRHGQYLADQFWKRWIAEYLPTLVKREKWHDPSKPLQVGDLVLVVNDLVPRSAWKKGVIDATYPAADGQVRKVDVRVAHVDPGDKKKTASISIYHRPAVKVCPLGLNVIVPGVTGRENVSAEAT